MSRPRAIALPTGFTIIELMLVLMAFLLFLSLVLIGVARQQAVRRDVTRTAAVAQMQKALAMYFAEYQTYPVMKGCITGEDDLSKDLFNRKLIEVGARLSDPKYPNEATGCYYYESIGNDYSLRYILETDSVENQGAHVVVP